MTTMDQQYPMGPAEYPPDPPGPQAGTFPRGAKKTQCESPTCSLSTLSPSMVSSSSSRSSTSSIMSLDQGLQQTKEDLLSKSSLPTSLAVNKSQESNNESPQDHPDLQNLSVVASGLEILLLFENLFFFFSSIWVSFRVFVVEAETFICFLKLFETFVFLSVLFDKSDFSHSEGRKFLGFLKNYFEFSRQNFLLILTLIISF